MSRILNLIKVQLRRDVAAYGGAARLPLRTICCTARKQAEERLEKTLHVFHATFIKHVLFNHTQGYKIATEALQCCICARKVAQLIDTCNQTAALSTVSVQCTTVKYHGDCLDTVCMCSCHYSPAVHWLISHLTESGVEAKILKLAKIKCLNVFLVFLFLKYGGKLRVHWFLL